MTALSSLSLEQKVGQLLSLGWQGEGPDGASVVNDHARVCIEEMQCGGLVFMTRNMRTVEQTARLAEQLQALAAIPLFIATDQEGGLVNRMVDPLTAFPGNMALGATQSEEFAYRQAACVARELRTVGVNWNFAPVVDVNNNPRNPVIGTRSYGEDPKLVARLGVAAAKGYQDNGVLACAKHFPGHGDTNVDSHLALPVVDHDRRRLNDVELAPFRALSSGGVGAMMTAHLVVRSLDVDHPATVSRAVLTALLREEMGFHGLIITDCMEMKAIANGVGTVRGSIQALKAGADIALVCHTLATQRSVHRAMIEAVESGELSVEVVDTAVTRVLAAKDFLFESGFEAPATPWSDGSHAALEREIARKAVTVVRNAGAIPIRPSAGDTIGVVCLHPGGKGLADAIRRHHPNTSAVVVSHVTSSKTLGELGAAEERSSAPVELNESEALHLAASAQHIVVTTCFQETRNYRPEQYKAQVALARRIAQDHPNAVFIALREPYDLQDVSNARHFLTGYSMRPCALNALAEALLGAIEPYGRLPVTVEV